MLTTSGYYDDENKNGAKPKDLGYVAPKALLGPDGRAEGVDPNVLGVVCVDPGYSDRVEVDLSKITPDVYSGAYLKSKYPHEVFQKLSQAAVTPVKPEPATPVMSLPPISLTPQIQSLPQLGQPILGNGANLLLQQPLSPPPAAASPQQAPPPVSAPTPPAAAPAPTDMLQQLYFQMGNFGQVLQQLTQRVDWMANSAQQAAKPAPERLPPLNSYDSKDNGDSRENHEPAVQTTQQALKASKPRDGVIVGFETLEIPFLTGPLPEKPQYEVFFQLPQLGTISMRYHGVVESQDLLLLVYDTRYEDGQQFLPPKLSPDQHIRVSVTRLSKTYLCASLGLHVTLGVLDLVLLIRQEEIDDVRNDGF